MKIYKFILFTLLFGGFFISCSKDADDAIDKPIVDGRDLTVEKFIYRGLNEIYLYKADVPELANDYFPTETERNDFLDNFATPEDLFYDDGGLLAPQDRFSWLVDDYVELENTLSGISTSNGISFGLVYYCGDSSNIYGYVRYVLPGTSAEAQGIKRGDVFNTIDGQQLTDSNYNDFLAPDTYSIGLATKNGCSITPTGESVALTKQEYTTNPVLVSKTLDVDDKKVGYLFYTSFTADFDPQLNDAFLQFKADGVTDLILDLRYNGGGSIRTATDLASMITGQFAGEIFSKEQWNAEYQAYFESENPERLLNRFNTTLKTGELINSLNLGRVFILTTSRSASASELVINGLDPYIDVVQIGETTTGKFQGSTPLYDSPNFGRLNVNLNHTYAMLPLVLKSTNSAGVSDYIDGLTPDFQISEDFENLGTLGEPNEPFLKVAIDVIMGNKISIPASVEIFKPVGESGMDQIDYQKMYIDKIPAIIEK
jgi:C-terminal processing protease CtpA/Prc